MLAVLCCILRVRYCLSVLVYAGLSLFIISGSYLYMVVCVLYAYNLAIEYSTSAQNGQVLTEHFKGYTM